MFLDIHELERHPLDFEEVFQPGVIDLGGEARQRTPLQASGHAEIVEEHHGTIEASSDESGIRVRVVLPATVSSGDLQADSLMSRQKLGSEDIASGSQ